MSSEERVVRPYLGVDRIQHVLDGVVILVGNDTVEPDGRLDLSTFDYVTRPVALSFAGEGVPLDEIREALSTGVEHVGVPLDDAELLALVSTSRLKISEIVWRLPLSQIGRLPAVVPIAEGEVRPAPLRTPFGGARIDLYVLLRRSRSPEPLRPWRKGTWLGRSSYEIGTDIGEIGFQPLPLDDTIRAKYSLPSNTTRYIRVESVLDPDVDVDAVELFVDQDLLAHLAQNSSLPAAKAFQRELFLDAAQAIVLQAVRSPELEEKSAEELESSLVGRLIALVAGRVPGERNAQRRQRRDIALSLLRSEPMRFMACLEAEIGSKADLADALKGAQS